MGIVSWSGRVTKTQEVILRLLMLRGSHHYFSSERPKVVTWRVVDHTLAKEPEPKPSKFMIPCVCWPFRMRSHGPAKFHMGPNLSHSSV